MQPGGLFPIAKGVFDMPPIAVGCHNLGGRPFRVIREENRFAPMGIAPRHTRVVINPQGELRTLCGLSHCGHDPVLQVGAGFSHGVVHPLSQAGDRRSPTAWGSRWAVLPIRTPPNSSSPPTGVAVMDTGSTGSRSNYNNSPTRSDSPFGSAIFRRGRASGIALSTACSISAISLNWRGRPLTSHAMVVQLIGHTRTKTGLRIQAALDTNA